MTTVAPKPRVQSPPPPAPTPQASGGYSPGPSTAAVKAGATLSRGHSGESVKDIQQRLNDAGIQPPLAVDGKLGPKTEAAIKQFQASNKLPGTGSVDALTLQTLERGATVENPSQTRARQGAGQTVGTRDNTRAPTQEERSTRPDGAQSAQTLLQADAARRSKSNTGTLPPGRAEAPFATDKAGREAQAENILRSNGQWPAKEGHVFALQIDQDSPGAGTTAKDKSDHLRAYTGQTAVYQVRQGKLVEIEGPMKSASHPGQKSTSGFTDINKDGKSDIAHLRAGVYEYRANSHNGRFNPVSNGDITVARDTNQDGTIDAGENAASAQRGDTAGALQWHAGTGTRPSSVGCQTMPPSDFSRFQRAVGAGDDKSFTYVLVRRPNDVHGANPL